MQPSLPTPSGVSRFIPGLDLFRGFSPALLRTELVVAVTVFRCWCRRHGLRRPGRCHPVAGLLSARRPGHVRAVWLLQAGHHGARGHGRDHDGIGGRAAGGGNAARYAALAALLALLVGVVSLLARVAKLGFITDLLSKPVLVGYIFGATLIVTLAQVIQMVFSELGGLYKGPVVQTQDLTVFNVTKEAVIARQAKQFDQLPPTPGKQRVAFQPVAVPPPDWWAEALIPLE